MAQHHDHRRIVLTDDRIFESLLGYLVSQMGVEATDCALDAVSQGHEHGRKRRSWSVGLVKLQQYWADDPAELWGLLLKGVNNNGLVSYFENGNSPGSQEQWVGRALGQ